MTEKMQQLLSDAKRSTGAVASLDEETRNYVLEDFATALVENTEYILQENAKDLENARGKIEDVMLDRLRLTAVRIQGMAQGILDVAKLPSPFGILEEILFFAVTRNCCKSWKLCTCVYICIYIFWQ